MAYNRPKRGRPAKAVTKAGYIHVRIESAQLESFEAQAEAVGMTFSDWVRTRLSGTTIASRASDRKLLALQCLYEILVDLQKTAPANKNQLDKTLAAIVDELQRADSLEAIEE